MRKAIRLLLVGGLVWGSGLARAAAPSGAVVLTVNRTTNGADLNPGDGVCDASVNAGEQCSLRAAIEEVNAQGPAATPHRIEFDIAGTGPFTITPAAGLPPLTVPVAIDGATQPGAACPTHQSAANLLIVLDGSNAGSTGVGLLFDTGSNASYLSGLVIGNFGLAGLQLTSDDNQVVCTHVGLAADGVTPLPNGLYGIGLIGDGNLLGDWALPGGRNVISGNGGPGVYGLEGADHNQLLNNFIGATADGLSAAGNAAGGVALEGASNIIASVGNAAPSVISGNDGYGVRLGRGDDNVLVANLIGVARDGVTSLPNAGNGIEVLGSATGNYVGAPLAIFQMRVSGPEGISTGGNVIANNGGHGVMLEDAGAGDPAQNWIYRNAIYANGGLGIDLGDDGVSANDAGDADGGANAGQNFPVLAAIAGSPSITVTLESAASQEYDVAFFRSQTCDPSGYGEGQQYLTTRILTTDSDGHAEQVVNLAAFVSPGNRVAATATDESNNTSEFSNCVTVVSLHPLWLPLIAR